MYVFTAKKADAISNTLICKDDSSLDQFPPVECFPQAAPPNHLDKHLRILLAEVMYDKYHLLSQHFFATIEAHLYDFLSSL